MLRRFMPDNLCNRLFGVSVGFGFRFGFGLGLGFFGLGFRLTQVKSFFLFCVQIDFCIFYLLFLQLLLLFVMPIKLVKYLLIFQFHIWHTPARATSSSQALSAQLAIITSLFFLLPISFFIFIYKRLSCLIDFYTCDTILYFLQHFLFKLGSSQRGKSLLNLVEKKYKLF